MVIFSSICFVWWSSQHGFSSPGCRGALSGDADATKSLGWKEHRLQCFWSPAEVPNAEMRKVIVGSVFRSLGRRGSVYFGYPPTISRFGQFWMDFGQEPLSNSRFVSKKRIPICIADEILFSLCADVQLRSVCEYQGLWMYTIHVQIYTHTHLLLTAFQNTHTLSQASNKP